MPNVGRKMVVLGTDHALQGVEKLDKSKKIDDPTFGVLLEKLVTDFSLDYIFEEASGLGPTTASKLQRFGLGYLDVDPPGNERQRYGIPPGLPIETFVIYDINDPRRPEPELYATKKEAATERGRESVWLEKINKTSFTNGLLICGAAHTFSLASLLFASSFSVDVIMYGVSATLTEIKPQPKVVAQGMEDSVKTSNRQPLPALGRH